MDVKRYPRFVRPGHAVTGDRTKTYAGKAAPFGHDFFHAVVDDHTRLTYGELLDDEKAATVTAFMERGPGGVCGARNHHASADDRRRVGLHPQSVSARTALRARVRHIVTPPYTPRWNGKVDRFHQTMEREWAKGLRYRNHHARNHALPHWLAHYNERRPHSGIGGRPPISRAPNLSRQDN